MPMDNFIEQSIDLNQMVVTLLLEKKKDTQRQWFFMLAMCLTMLLCFVVFSYHEAQARKELMQQLQDTRVDFMEYLDSIEYMVTTETTTTTETTQAVEGENAAIHNISGDQYNDNAVHNGGE